MSYDSEKYWADHKSESMKKFEKTISNITSHERTFWMSLMTIQATILGISMAFTQYLDISASGFLKTTWCLLILSIGVGIVVFKCSLYGESISALKQLQFSLDMADFNMKYEKKEFKSEEEAIGMFTAAFLKFDAQQKDDCFTPYAKELAKKYKTQLPSEKFFKKDAEESGSIRCYRNFLKFLNKNINVLMLIFYVSTFGAFLTLLICIFAK